ncbi:hypothetical protein KEM55_001511 [Ascosphaera atra]|nr:hypothetical protein KEM55_001511 [Ascosphaera atra]
MLPTTASPNILEPLDLKRLIQQRRPSLKRAALHRRIDTRPLLIALGALVGVAFDAQVVRGGDVSGAGSLAHAPGAEGTSLACVRMRVLMEDAAESGHRGVAFGAQAVGVGVAEQGGRADGAGAAGVGGDNGNGNGNVITTSTTPISPKHLESTLRILTGSIDSNSNNSNNGTPPPRKTDALDYCPSPDINLDDDEVFDAMNAPLKINRKRLSMSREERIARVKGERARMAARARPDGNAGGNAGGPSTSMLRELETVIKLRPQPANGGGNGAAGAEGSVNANAGATVAGGSEPWRRHKKGRTSI